MQNIIPIAPAITITVSQPNRPDRELTITSLRPHYFVDAARRMIIANVQPIQRPIPLYSLVEFEAHAADTEAQHQARLLEILGDDKQASLEAIANQVGPITAPEISPQIQAVYDTAMAAFESMSIGKQAMWEPVKQAVAKAVLSGDIPKAVAILQTLPATYEGAEQERQAFLALFAQP